MPATRPHSILSAELPERVSTRAGVESPVTRAYGREDVARDRWQNVIDHQLIEWGRDPSQLEDEGVEAPTTETIGLAIFFAQTARDQGEAPPDSVVPDANGGIVFERREGDVSEVYHIWDDGSLEYRRFEGSLLVERRAMR